MNNIINIKRKNIRIEFLRMWFTICVCLHHFRMYSDIMPYGGGYLAVDFFFMLSGFYLYHYMVGENNDGNIFRYIKHRYYRLWPDYAWAFFSALTIGMVFDFYLEKISILENIQEFLMLDLSYMPVSHRLNSPDWYCFYLLFSTFIILLFFRIIKKYSLCIMILVSGMIYVCLYFRVNHLNIYPDIYYAFWMVFGRALAGMILGIGIGILSFKCQCLKIPTYFENVIFFFLLIISSYRLLFSNGYTRTDFAMLVVFSVLILCCDMRKNTGRNTWIDRLALFGGEISYVVFLNHYAIAFLFTKYQLMGEYNWKIISMIFLFVVAVISITQYFIIKGMKRIFLRERI